MRPVYNICQLKAFIRTIESFESYGLPQTDPLISDDGLIFIHVSHNHRICLIFGKSWLSFTPVSTVFFFAMHLASPAVPIPRPLPALLTKLQELHVAPRRCDEWIEEDEGHGGLCGGPFLRQHKISQTEFLVGFTDGGK